MMINKRISQIKNYKGNDTGFARLYAAIWEKAVEDELRHQMHRLMMDVYEKLFFALLKYDREERDTYSKIGRIVSSEYGLQGRKLSQWLETLIDEKREVMKKAVQWKIYREAQAWPDNKRRCPEFEKAYLQIRDNVLEAFSGRRCG